MRSVIRTYSEKVSDEIEKKNSGFESDLEKKFGKEDTRTFINLFKSKGYYYSKKNEATNSRKREEKKSINDNNG